jgi:tetratricopeptide (TPR) repeat protein
MILIQVLAGPALADRTDESLEKLFFQANQAYRDGRFQEAIDGYLKLVQSGIHNGHLYYNLANAYFRTKDPGMAILYYERARLFIPRDPDLNFNLRYVLEQAPDAGTGPQGFIRATFFWLNDLNRDELFRTFAVLNLLFWGGLTLRLYVKSDWIYHACLTVLVFWLMAGASFFLKCYEEETDERAVIIQEEAEVLAGPDIQETALYKLRAGTLVGLERSEDTWALIRFSEEGRGWIRSDALRVIRVDE